MHAAGAVRLTVDTRRQPASQCFAQYLQCLLRGQAGCTGLLARQHGLSLRQCLVLSGQRLQRIGRCRRLRRGGRRGRCCACRGLQQARLGMRGQLRGECGLPFAQVLLTCGQPGLSVGQLLAAQIRHSQLMEQGWITHQILRPIGAKPQHASSIASVAARRMQVIGRAVHHFAIAMHQHVGIAFALRVCSGMAAGVMRADARPCRCSGCSGSDRCCWRHGRCSGYGRSCVGRGRCWCCPGGTGNGRRRRRGCGRG